MFYNFVAPFFLISLVPPLSDQFSVENKYMEEGVEEEDNVMFDGHTVQKYGHRRSIESVRHEGRLNHDERIVNVLFVQGMAESSSAYILDNRKKGIIYR